MEYNPPKPLPDPYCDDFDFADENPPAPVSSPVPGPVPAPTDKPVQPTEQPVAPTEQPVEPTKPPVPAQSSNKWGTGCLGDWGDCMNNRNGCCDGLYCQVHQHYAQCRPDPSSKCLIKDAACHNTKKSCCDGLKRKG